VPAGERPGMSTNDAPKPLRYDLRSYGRRHGRRLSDRQQRLLRELLPRLSLDLAKPPPVALSQLFEAAVREVWLEIGFGGGEHLVWQALRQPTVGVIGCEPFIDGVVKVLSAVEHHQLANLRLHAGDGREVLRWLPQGSLARVFVLFPDPWPKRRHLKRRLVSPQLLGELARVMAPGAELRFATDVGDYAGFVLASARSSNAFHWLAEAPADWRTRPSDWPQTRYEEKALGSGRRCIYLRFARR
jgi:tRNA (guanine-N7-)-methyltransferase